MGVNAHNPSTERWRKGGSGVSPANLLAQQASGPVRELVSQGIRWKVVEKNTQHPSLPLICLHADTLTIYMCAHTLPHIHVCTHRKKTEHSGRIIKVIYS